MIKDVLSRYSNNHRDFEKINKAAIWAFTPYLIETAQSQSDDVLFYSRHYQHLKKGN